MVHFFLVVGNAFSYREMSMDSTASWKCISLYFSLFKKKIERKNHRKKTVEPPTGRMSQWYSLCGSVATAEREPFQGVATAERAVSGSGNRGENRFGR